MIDVKCGQMTNTPVTTKLAGQEQQAPEIAIDILTNNDAVLYLDYLPLAW